MLLPGGGFDVTVECKDDGAFDDERATGADAEVDADEGTSVPKSKLSTIGDESIAYRKTSILYCASDIEPRPVECETSILLYGGIKN